MATRWRWPAEPTWAGRGPRCVSAGGRGSCRRAHPSSCGQGRETISRPGRCCSSSSCSTSANSWNTVAMPIAIAAGTRDADDLALEFDGAVIGLVDACDQPRDGRLARGVVADEGATTSPLRASRFLPSGRVHPEDLVDVGEHQQRCGVSHHLPLFLRGPCRHWPRPTRRAPPRPPLPDHDEAFARRQQRSRPEDRADSVGEQIPGGRQRPGEADALGASEWPRPRWPYRWPSPRADHLTAPRVTVVCPLRNRAG